MSGLRPDYGYCYCSLHKSRRYLSNRTISRHKKEVERRKKEEQLTNNGQEQISADGWEDVGNSEEENLTGETLPDEESPVEEMVEQENGDEYEADTEEDGSPVVNQPAKRIRLAVPNLRQIYERPRPIPSPVDTPTTSPHESDIGELISDEEDEEEHLDEVDQAAFNDWFAGFDIKNMESTYDLRVSISLKIAVRLLHWKSTFNISDNAYSALKRILKDCGVNTLGMKGTITKLQRELGIIPKVIDCCINQCLAYTGRFRMATRCYSCNESRYDVEHESDIDVPSCDEAESEVDDTVPYQELYKTTKRRPRKRYIYIPLVPALIMTWRCPMRSKIMKDHRRQLLAKQREYKLQGKQYPLTDTFDGKIVQDYLIGEKGLFKDLHDMALQIQMDAVLVIKGDGGGRPRHVTPVIIQNQNLPMHLRTKKRNLLVSMILPGPGEPTHYHSFTRPLWKDLERLDKGIKDVIDGSDIPGGRFTLRAHITSFIGDQKAANNMAKLRGAGSKSGCRMCTIKGTLVGSKYYYPNQPNYKPRQLPLRKDFHLKVREACLQQSEKKMKEIGVSGYSALLTLPKMSVHFARGLPYPLMHLVVINLVEIKLKLWMGKYDFDKDSDAPYILTKEQWIQIGQELDNARQTLPDAFGPAPLNIYTRYKSYKRKAIQKHNLMLLYLPTIMHGKLPEPYYSNLLLLCKAYTLTMSRSVTPETIEAIQELWCRYNETFERHYVKVTLDGDSEPDRKRTILMTSNIHGTLHIAQQIKDHGPAYGWCEWGLEDFLGPLRRMARSKTFVDESAMQAMWAKEIIKYADMSRKDFILGNLWSLEKKDNIPKKAYEIETGYLLPKAKEYNLTNDIELKRQICNYFRNSFVHPNGKVGHTPNLPEFVILYDRYKIKGSTIIGSESSQRTTSVNRANHYIQYTLPPAMAIALKAKSKFGRVDYFFKMATDVRRQGRFRQDEYGMPLEIKDGRSSASTDALQNPNEHYFAVVYPWNCTSIEDPKEILHESDYDWLDVREGEDEDEAEDRALKTSAYINKLESRRVRFNSENKKAIIIDVRRIHGVVGRMISGGKDWVISPSIYPIYDPISLGSLN